MYSTNDEQQLRTFATVFRSDGWSLAEHEQTLGLVFDDPFQQKLVPVESPMWLLMIFHRYATEFLRVVSKRQGCEHQNIYDHLMWEIFHQEQRDAELKELIESHVEAALTAAHEGSREPVEKPDRKVVGCDSAGEFEILVQGIEDLAYANLVPNMIIGLRFPHKEDEPQFTVLLPFRFLQFISTCILEMLDEMDVSDLDFSSGIERRRAMMSLALFIDYYCEVIDPRRKKPWVDFKGE